MSPTIMRREFITHLTKMAHFPAQLSISAPITSRPVLGGLHHRYCKSDFSVHTVGRVISRTTLATVGIDVSPQLFPAAASTAAVYAGSTPHLASALLHHTDPAVTDEHYNRASTLSAIQAYVRADQSHSKR